MSQGVGNAHFVAELVDEVAELGHVHLALLAVGAEQAGLDELGPRDDAGVGGFDSDDRRVGLAPLCAAFQPVVERARGYAKQPSRFGFGVHLSIENRGRVHSGTRLTRTSSHSWEARFGKRGIHRVQPFETAGPCVRVCALHVNAVS